MFICFIEIETGKQKSTKLKRKVENCNAKEKVCTIFKLIKYFN